MKHRDPVSVAAIQMRCSSDVDDNLNRAMQVIAKAANDGADLICLQELFSSRYFCQSEDHDQFKLAESIPGRTTEALSKAAAQHNVVIVGGLFERRSAGLFHNSAVVFETDGSLVGTYRKMHIPDDPFFYEKFYFTPGDLGFQAISTSVGKLGICICWDQWFPEAARLTALAGAEILIYPTAIGWQADEKEAFGASQLNAWQTMMRSHAIANGVFVVAPNRVGVEDNIEFWGNSFVSDPYGNLLKAAADDAEETLLVECDLDLIETARTHWPFLRDRRIDAYRRIDSTVSGLEFDKMTCYRMPAEWQPQAATWVAWPHNSDTWPHNLAEAQSEFTELVQTIARCQKVFVLCGGPALQQARKAFPASNSNVVLVDIPTNDAWARDYGPTFVADEADRQLIALDWHYNAWGSKYPPFDQDQQVAKKVAQHLQVECVSPNLCFEGGAIEINQSGVVLSTKSCALDPKSKPRLFARTGRANVD